MPDKVFDDAIAELDKLDIKLSKIKQGDVEVKIVNNYKGFENMMKKMNARRSSRRSCSTKQSRNSSHKRRSSPKCEGVPYVKIGSRSSPKRSSPKRASARATRVKRAYRRKRVSQYIVKSSPRRMTPSSLITYTKKHSSPKRKRTISKRKRTITKKRVSAKKSNRSLFTLKDMTTPTIHIPTLHVPDFGPDFTAKKKTRKSLFVL